MVYRQPSKHIARNGDLSKWTTSRRDHASEQRRIPSPLGTLIRTLKIEDIASTGYVSTAAITDCEYLASFNLMGRSSQSILVPGQPALWTPSSRNMKLRPDAGDYLEDHNAARFPDYPYEPAVQAVLHLNTELIPAEIDVAACGSTLASLYRFVEDQAGSFSFVARMVGQTVFFVRRSISPTALIAGIHGFGHSFVEANTTWSKTVKGTESHQRVLRYSLGGMTMMVRYEADAYIMDQTEIDEPVRDSSEGDELPGIDTLGAMFAGSLGPQICDTSQAPLTSLDAKLIEKGSRVAQDAIVEIKTRSVWKNQSDVLEEQLPRLWLRQIDRLVLSFHSKGNFEPAQIKDVQQDVLEWEAEHKDDIGRLAALVAIIKEAARSARDGALEVRRLENGDLHLQELTAEECSHWHAISEHSRSMWEV